MRALGVVKGKVFCQPDQQFPHRGVAVEVHVFMLDAAPKPLHKDVVVRPAPTVHTDGNALAFQNVREYIAGELAALVAVEHLGLAMLSQGVFQAVHAERRFHAVADAPTQHPPGIPVDHSHQVGKASLQAHVGDVRTPDLIRPHHRHPTQQIGVHLVLWVRRAGVRPWRHPGQEHGAHEALYPLAVDPVATAKQVHHHLAATVERMARVFLIDQALEHFVDLDEHHWLALGVDRRARHAGQHALALLRQVGMNANPAVPDHGRLIPDFFLSQSSSILSRPISP